MEKKSRFELIKIVEAQKEQLVRYETRLRGEDLLKVLKFILGDPATTAGARSVRSLYFIVLFGDDYCKGI